MISVRSVYVNRNVRQRQSYFVCSHLLHMCVNPFSFSLRERVFTYTAEAIQLLHTKQKLSRGHRCRGAAASNYVCRIPGHTGTCLKSDLDLWILYATQELPDGFISNCFKCKQMGWGEMFYFCFFTRQLGSKHCLPRYKGSLVGNCKTFVLQRIGYHGTVFSTYHQRLHIKKLNWTKVPPVLHTINSRVCPLESRIV